MFDIDDDFLQSIGYNVTALADEQKAQYKQELTEELQARLSERVGSELEESQVDDFESIQNSTERAEQWLHEFHADFHEAQDYKTLVDALGDTDAKVFYASALWMWDAVPDYGLIVREEFDKYQNELVEKRKMVNQALGL